MKRLYIMVGNIGSGKTTYVKSYGQGAFVVSRDALRYMLGAGEYTFLKVTEPAIKEATAKLVHELMHTKEDIIYDETNVNIDMRKDKIRLAQKHGYRCIALVLPRLPKKLSVDRRMKNPHGQGKSVWNSVWTRFNDIYEEPTQEEGFFSVIRVKDEEVGL